MLDQAVKKLIRNGALLIELITRTDNTASQKLYTRYGFKKVRNFGFKNEFVDYVLKAGDVH